MEELTAPSLLQKNFSSEEIMKKEAFYSPWIWLSGLCWSSLSFRKRSV